jgi:diguanylate cyclase (GGDEF)-like protein/PAS domain S-box-containing protein
VRAPPTDLIATPAAAPHAGPELENALSLLRATLDATADGILVVDAAGRISGFNRRFTQMWRLNDVHIELGADVRALDHLLALIARPEPFIERLRALRRDPDTEIVDVLDLKDGRAYECFSIPQKVGERAVGRVWSFHDISEGRRAERALQESEERYRRLVERSPDAIFVFVESRIAFVNSAALALLGCASADEVVGREVYEVVAAEYHEHARERIARIAEGAEQMPRMEQEYVRMDGARVPVEVASSRFRFHGEEAVMSVVRDISERKRSERRMALLIAEREALFENALIGIAYLRGRQVVRCNEAFAQMFGYGRAEMAGMSTRQLHESEHAYEQRGQDAYPAIAERGYFSTDAPMRRKDGSLFWANYRLSPIDRNDLAQGVVWVVQDISERKQAEERLLHLAHYDLLTQLPNRALFRDRLNQALAQARRKQCKVGVLFVDLDRFKEVNDRCGHDAGDGLLRVVAERLVASVRASDTVARLGGDEFAVILPEMGEAPVAGHVAQKILAGLAEPVQIGTHSLSASASIGISVFPDDSEDPQMLIKSADAAMFRAKEQGRHAYRYFADAAAR